ncbi:MAG: aminotransferase class IV family protein [Bacteroidota bacterium]|nr:aminotransferase class IV family protein [Bacteroidota bacterium]
MCQLVESLKLKNGIVQNLEYHQRRMNRSMNELFPGAGKINLAEAISIPENCQSGLFKVRILYGRFIEKIEIEPYTFRTIQSLKVVHHESIDYHLKYTDRHILQELFAQRGNCDDIIILKNGLVSDSFAANLLFFDGEKWFTPTVPLLKGTKRQLLLDRGIISEKDIREEDIRSYQKIGLINAMIDMDEMPVINIDRIVC